MSENHTPRHAMEESEPSRGPLIAAGAVVAAIALGAGVFALVNPGSDKKESASSSSSASAAASSATTCANSTRLAVDPAWSQAVTAAVKSWSTSQKQDCSLVQVDERSSSEVAQQGLGNDTGWVPEDGSWVSQAKDSTLAKSTTTSVGSSPFVLALPTAAADALKTPLNGSTLTQLVTTQKTWADFGHKEWGRFKLTLPDVGKTAAGAAGYAALVGEVGQGAQPQVNYLSSDATEQAIARIQQRVVATVPAEKVDAAALAAHSEDANGYTTAGPRAGLTTTYQLLQHPGGLKATPVLDGAGLTMQLANPSNNQTLKSFASWLGTQEGQKALAAQGVSTATQQPDAAKLKAVGLSSTSAVKPNDAQTLSTYRQVYAGYAKRSSLMLVLDTSGSMGGRLPNGMRKIDILLQEITSSWDVWPNGMSNGLMIFNAKNGSNAVNIQTIVPLQPDTTVAWQKTQQQLKPMLGAVPVGGGTPLYEAIVDGWKYNTEHYQAGKENDLIVITDGSNQDSNSKVTVQQTITALSAKDPSKPIKAYFVGLGPSADMSALQQIATGTGQTALKVSDPTQLVASIEKYLVRG